MSYCSHFKIGLFQILLWCSNNQDTDGVLKCQITKAHYNFLIMCQYIFHFGRDLTLKVPITTAADNINKYFFIVFQRK